MRRACFDVYSERNTMMEIAIPAALVTRPEIESFATLSNVSVKAGLTFFEIVKLVEGLTKFEDQKAWIIKKFELKIGTSKPWSDGPIDYNYTDEKGNLLFQTVRYDPKRFSQRRPNGSGEWIWNLQGMRLVLYRLPEVVAASHVLIVEGGKRCRIGLKDWVAGRVCSHHVPNGGWEMEARVFGKLEWQDGCNLP